MDKLLLRLMLLENTLRVTTVKNYPNARHIRIEPHNQIKRFYKSQVNEMSSTASITLQTKIFPKFGSCALPLCPNAR
jgi:hypothetical protein